MEWMHVSLTILGCVIGSFLGIFICTYQTEKEYSGPYPPCGLCGKTDELNLSHWSLANKNLDVVNFGNHPFVIPDKAYSSVLGVLSAYIEPMYYNRDEQFL